MAHVVAGIYEIQQQIGSGGGGVVYLGRHLRLNKLVVLKADKRALSVKPEALRREVDMLKELSHTYIPQVYDFVEEDGVVYTVMDYIDGESLDKILKRGQTPPQPQLIRWACQLLEALSYLHSRPPHGILHADIKPANIMLRPNGDICLIDYNIALALGENGAVKVGYSIGYASPEHYGIEANIQIRERQAFKSGGQSGNVQPTASGQQAAYVQSPILGEKSAHVQPFAAGASPAQVRSVGSYGTGTGSVNGRRSVMLDVRSDIYSLGATLYHLISGKRPPKEGYGVAPLEKDVCSPAIAHIIKKAMELNPDDRYQSADEMLADFHGLHKRDKRTVRHKRRMRAAAAMLTLMFLAGGTITFIGLKQMENRQTALTLAEYSEKELEKGNVTGAIEYALQAIPQGEDILEAPVTANARKALTDALNVYDLSDRFQSLDTVLLPSAPYGVAQAPDGKHFAAVCQSGVKVYETENRKLLADLEIVDSALAEAEFVDNTRLVYAGKNGVSLYDIEKGEILWTAGEATTLSVSGDGMVVAAVNRNEGKAAWYSAENGVLLSERSFEGRGMETAFNDIFANPDNRIFSLNEDGSLLAVSFSDGALIVFDIKNPEEDLFIYEESSFLNFEGGFCQNLFAFTAGKSDQYLFGLVDCAEGVYAGEFESRNKMRILTNEEGIWLSEGNLLVCFDPESLEETEMAFTDTLNIEGFSLGDSYILVTTDDTGFSFYDSGTNLMSHANTEEEINFTSLAGGYGILANRSQPEIRLLKLENHEEASLFSYDARFIHDEARISGDGKTVMLFNYEKFQIYDMEGKQLEEGTFPDSEKIYDQQFRKNGADSYLEIIWYDGTVIKYSAADGTMISEEKGAPPDKTLYEEFFTARYRIESPLHGTPEVYDLESGNRVASLESEDYLTYVTELEDYLVTEYVNAEGERYGLLLDGGFEPVAYLPNLCDIAGDKLVFDYKSGNLRQSRLYSLQELMTLGEAYMENYRRENE